MLARPTFLGIGSDLGAAGEAICGALKQHPQVFVHQQVGLGFFLGGASRKGLGAYLSQMQSPLPARGEYSSDYWSLSAGRIRTVSRILPNLRVFLIIDEPTTRIWRRALQSSHGAPDEAELIARVLLEAQRPEARLLLDSLELVRRWRTVLGGGALLVQTLGEFRTAPQQTFEALLAHLQVDPALAAEYPTLAASADSPPMPAYARWYVAAECLDSTLRLNEVLDGRVSQWVVAMQDVIRQGAPSWPLRRAKDRALYGTLAKLGEQPASWWRDRRLRRHYATLQAQAHRLA